MAEAPVLSTKNNNNNISPQPWELGLSQRQSGGGEVLVLVLALVGLVLLLALAFGRYMPRLGSERSSAVAERPQQIVRVRGGCTVPLQRGLFQMELPPPASLHADRCWLSSEGASPEFTQRPHNNISAQICL